MPAMKRFGLIGYPLSHSFSKKYFEDKFLAENITDAAFHLFPLERVDDLPALLLAHTDLCGLAVTIPYKESVISFLTSADMTAAEIGAVNCVKITGKELIGRNTDVIGFEQSFTPLLQPQHSKALILGTGGAAKAVQYVLRKNKIPYLAVSREAGEGRVAYEDLNRDALDEFRIVINCSPVGMPGFPEDQPAIPYHFLSDQHYLYDLVYAPGKTLFLQQGEKRGCIIKDGLEMLHIQAEENWRIWNR